MAEAAASIAGLICFAAQAAQAAAKLHGFFTAFAEAPQEIQNLSRDLLHLHGLLSNVANIGMKLEKTTFVGDTILLDLESCKLDLEKLDNIANRLQPGLNYRGIIGKGRSVWDRMKWAFLELEIMKSMDQLASHKHTISLALSTLGRSLDIQAMMSVKSLQDSVNKIIDSQDKNNTDAMEARLDQIDMTTEAIRRSLGTISHHIQNSSPLALHENLVAMIRSEIASGVQAALVSTLSGADNGGNPPIHSLHSGQFYELLQTQQPENFVTDNTLGLGGDMKRSTSTPATGIWHPTVSNSDYYGLENMDLSACGSSEFSGQWESYQSSQSSTSSSNLRYRKYHRYETVFGVLLVFISNGTTHWDMFPQTFRDRRDSFEAGFTFIPASWLFRTAFAASFVKYAGLNGESSISTNLSYYAIVPHNAKIMEFARSGNVDGIRELFSQRIATPRDRDPHGRTPLHWAASVGNYETCKFLLENGADPSATNDVSRTPLHWTTLLSCNTDIINLLISRGCDPSIPNISGQNALFAHDTIGRMNDLIRAIVHQDHFVVDLDHVDYLGRTPLMWEVYEMNDNTDSSAALIKGGASVTRKDNQGLTVLHHALLCSKTEYKKETIKLLLNSGADPLARGNDGITPTGIAKHFGVLRKWEETLSECGFNLDRIGREYLGEAISTTTESMISLLRISTPNSFGVKRRHAATLSMDIDTLVAKPPERDYTFSIDQIPRRIQYTLLSPYIYRGSQNSIAYASPQIARPYDLAQPQQEYQQQQQSRRAYGSLGPQQSPAYSRFWASRP